MSTHKNVGLIDLRTGDHVRIVNVEKDGRVTHTETWEGVVDQIEGGFIQFEGTAERLWIPFDFTIDIIHRPLAHKVGDVLTTAEEYAAAPIGLSVETRPGAVRWRLEACWHGDNGVERPPSEMSGVPRTVVLAAPEVSK